MALIQADFLPGRGDQLLTFDSSTGLEWLNLTVTANRSYIDVLSGFGGFIGAFGFQYATPNQVGTLYKHAGVTKFGGPQAGLDLANQVMQSLGETQTAMLDINGFARNMSAIAHKNRGGEIRFILLLVKMVDVKN